MTAADLSKLIADGETLRVEFKGEANSPLSDGDLVAAVVCLANNEGGQILIGVEDDRRVTGARPRHGHVTDRAKLAALIRNRTVPPVEALPTHQTAFQVLASDAGMKANEFFRKPEDHTRVHGLDPVRQEASVLQFAASHGTVRRENVMELCGLDRSQAYRLLQRLVATGRLVPKGEKRGRTYHPVTGRFKTSHCWALQNQPP
jgi:ATP-dependent DNA helicase RecG